MSKTFKEKTYVIDEFDLYKILDIDTSFKQDEIILHYQKLVRKYHPARFSFQLLSTQDLKDIRLIFSKISIAYNVLSEFENRKNYDRERIEILNTGSLSELKSLYEKFKNMSREKPFKDKLHILNESDLYIVLDAEPEISEKDLRSHYRMLVNKYHPDKYSFQILSAKESHELNQIFSKISDAYNVLKDPEKRLAYDKERKFMLAQTEISSEDRLTVDNVFKNSNINPEKVKKEQSEKFFNTGLKDINNNSLDNAIDNFKSAIKIMPKEAKYHFQLALALEKKGWDEYAKTEFKITLNLDPNNKIAQEKIKKGSGLFKNILGLFKRK